MESMSTLEPYHIHASVSVHLFVRNARCTLHIEYILLNVVVSNVCARVY